MQTFPVQTQPLPGGGLLLNLNWTKSTGNDYAEKYPEAMHLKETIYRIFQCKHKRTAQRHYELFMAMRKEYVISLPEAASIFATLERHWPKLVNAVGSKVIPKPTMLSNWLSASSISTTKTSAALTPSRPHITSWGCLSWSFALHPSPWTKRRTSSDHQNNASVASARSNWLSMTCSSCQPLRSAAGFSCLGLSLPWKWLS